MPRKKEREADPNENTVEGGMEEGNARTEIEEGSASEAEASDGQPEGAPQAEEAQASEAEGVSDEQAAQTNWEALSDEQRDFLKNEAAQESFEVQLNPKLGIRAPEQVEINGMLFYADRARNLSEGTVILSDRQYDDIKDVKEPESGVQYVVKK